MRERHPPLWPSLTTDGRTGLSAVGAPLMSELGAPTSGPPPLLRGLQDAEVAEVLAAGTRKVLYRGATLFKQGSKHNGIYLIESGRIKVFYVAPSGQEITLAYWQSGQFVGGPDVFDTGIHAWSGVAALNSSVVHLPGKALRELIERIPALGISVIEGLAFKGNCYSAMAQMLGTRSATQRLAQLLLHLSNLYGVEEKGGTLIAASFTHTDIANMIGTTRQWVSTALTRYAEAGLLGRHRSHIVLLDAEALINLRDSRGGAD